MSAVGAKRPSQGDLLNARKLERKGLLNTPEGAPARAGDADVASASPASSESRFPAVKSAAPAPLKDSPQEAAGREVTELVRTQLRMDPPPLGVPPVREDDEVGTAGSHYYETMRRAAAPTPQPPPKPESRGSDNVATGLALSKGDYYFRPDLDAVSQRVVLMSLAKQKEEEEMQKDYVARRREVILAKFEALRRDRVLLEMEAGLPVSDARKAAYGVLNICENHATKLRKSQAKKRAQNVVRREEVLEHTREVERPRILEAARHRAEMRNTMVARKEVRLMKESMLGTGNFATFRSCRNTATNHDQTIAEVNRDFVEAHRQQEEAKDIAACQAELDSFDAAAYGKATGPKRPRQRDLPYDLAAPYRHIPAHRAPIIMTDEEKGVAPAVGQ